MSNHGNINDPEMRKLLEEQEFSGMFDADNNKKEDFIKQFRQSEMGATGKFPNGKLTEHDEGELAFAVGTTDKEVVIEFKEPIAWLGMQPEQAKQLGKLLINKANRILNSNE